MTLITAKTKPSNAHIYERSLRILLEQIGNLPLSALTLEHIDTYITKRAQGHSPVTVNMEIRALQTAFRLAVKWKLLTENPFAEAEQLEEPDTLPLFMTKDDLDTYLKAVPYTWFKELVCFAVGTGMRQGEIVNLTWSQIDFDRRLIYVESNEYYRTKTNKKRTVPMSDAVFLLLQGKALRPHQDLVFTQRGRAIVKDYAGHLFKKCLAKTALNPKLHFHSLRHTHATLLVQAGVPIYAVSKLLGHSGVRVTERYYAGLSPDNLHDEVNRANLSFNLN